MPLKFEGKKILFVNDDAAFIKVRTEFLSNAGATVVSALTPKEAYDRLKESKFDLIEKPSSCPAACGGGE